MATEDTTFDLNRKKKSSKRRSNRPVPSETQDENILVESLPTLDIESTEDFTYEFLLERAIGNNPLAPIERINLPPPTLGRKGKKSTLITNITILARALKRPENMLQDYFSTELGTTASLGDSHGLTLRARLSQAQVEHVLRSFIREYVLCKNCHSPSTFLKKEERLTVMDCQTCHSKYTVANLRTTPWRRTNDN